MKLNISSSFSQKFCFLIFCVFSIILFVTKIQYLFIERIWPDEALYAWYAQKIYENLSFIFLKELMYPPLIPIILSLGNHILSPEISCRFISLLINLLGTCAIYKLGCKISGRFLGVYSAILLGLNSIYYFCGTTILLDGPLTVEYIILAILLINITTSKSRADHILVGLWGGVVILTKISAISSSFFGRLADHYKKRKKDFRYLMPIMPCIFIISGIGLEFIINCFFRLSEKRRDITKIVILVIILFSMQLDIRKNETIMRQYLLRYRGYAEEGKWIKNHASKNHLVITAAIRTIRYYTGIVFMANNGQLMYFPKDKEYFEKFVRETQQPILLALDIWEYTQPPWIYPFREEERDYIESLNFKLRKVVRRPFINKSKSIDFPVA